MPAAGKYLPPRRRSEPAFDQVGHDRFDPPVLDLSLLKWQFRCRAEQLRTGDVGIRRVDHHPLDGLTEQGFGVVDQVGVQRVVACDQHHEGALTAPAGAPGLLPERRNGAGKSCHQDRIESCDVDPQFQGVGGGKSPQLAVGQRTFQLRRSSARYPER